MAKNCCSYQPVNHILFCVNLNSSLSSPPPPTTNPHTQTHPKKITIFNTPCLTYTQCNTKTEIDMSLLELESYYDSVSRTSNDPTNSIDVLSFEDLSKINSKMTLPSNQQGLPSLSLLENLKLATVSTFVSATKGELSLHVHIQFKLFHKDPYHLMSSSNQRLALSTDKSTNYIVIDATNGILFTKGNQIYLKGRHIVHHKKSDIWEDDVKHSARNNLISNTILTITKEIKILVSCQDERTSATIPANSIVNIPYGCSIASDSFEIPKLRSTSSISIEYNLQFLRLSHGHNVTHIKDIREAAMVAWHVAH